MGTSEHSPENQFENAIQNALKEICNITIPVERLGEITAAIGDTYSIEKLIQNLTARIGKSALQNVLDVDIPLDRQTPIRSRTDQAEGHMELAAISGTMSINKLLASAPVITKENRIATSTTDAVLKAAIDTFLDAQPAFVESVYADVMVALEKIDKGELLKSAIDLADNETGDAPSNRELVALYLLYKLESEMDISDRLYAKFLGI